jgi:RNA polymerase sigma-70 factor (ECF subfamily)
MDVEGFVEAAYSSHRMPVTRYVARMTRDADLADELVQEAFLRLTVAVRRGSPPDDPGAWLHRVAGNLALSWFRHRRVIWSNPRSEDHRTVPEPQDVPVRRERILALESALAGLPERQRTAVVLAAHGYRGPEIGALLGTSDLATRALLMRARRTLRADRQLTLAMAEERIA